MNTLVKLIKREYQEHRVTFLYVPVGITLFVVGVLLLGLAFIEVSPEGITIDAEHDYDEHGVVEGKRTVVIDAYWGERLEQLANMPLSERKEVMTAAYFGVNSLLLVTMWFVVAFYLLGSLYDDRKDRSILFWRSMPVSDEMTIASKFAAALLVVPAIYFAFSVVLHLAMLVIGSISAMTYDVPIYETLWQPFSPILTWFTLIAFHLMTIFWCLPFYAWLTLTSAYSRAAPLAFALATPIALIIVDKLLIPGNFISEFITEHTAPIGWEEDDPRDVGMVFSDIMSLELIVALVIAAAMICGTIYLRRRADEI